MKFVKSILKVWPEIMVLLSSMSYIIIRLVADKRMDKFEVVDAL